MTNLVSERFSYQDLRKPSWELENWDNLLEVGLTGGNGDNRLLKSPNLY